MSGDTASMSGDEVGMPDDAGRMAEVLQRAWSDADFRARLKREPAAVLAEHGVATPGGAAVVVLEDTEALQHVVLPVAGEQALEPARARADGPALERAFVRALAEPDYRRRLVAMPRETLRSEGADLPDGLAIRVVENAPDRVHLVLPRPPAEGEVSDEDLVAASGGIDLSNLLKPILPDPVLPGPPHGPNLPPFYRYRV